MVPGWLKAASMVAANWCSGTPHSRHCCGVMPVIRQDCRVGQEVGRRLAIQHDRRADLVQVGIGADRGELGRAVAARLGAEGFVVVPEESVVVIEIMFLQQGYSFWQSYSEATRKQFIDVIQGGFEKGFKEAQSVLEGLKVLGGEVAAGIDKTYALVLKGYQDFIKPPAPADETGGSGSTAGSASASSAAKAVR
jgi:hypothetical protein